ncbi:c-type cytochrome [Parvularcula oceani]|uniref:c-type cytochrome n=1 Tax=Parvularcula oceani TaxID=1247963 RepID=UPI0005602AB8|nr:cytochrome c [Parvularcula oceani]
MTTKRKQLGVGAIAGALGLLALLGIFGLITVYSGGYNVAATEDHSAFGRWALSTTMTNSIEARAPADEPPTFTAAMARAGAGEYKAMCQHCHGGPGIDRAGWAKGMLPQPPHLTEAAAHWEPNEIFWILDHGIKSSGMPAFGPSHSDEDLWNLTAFVTGLPGMTQAEYEALGGSNGHDGGHSH